MLGERLRIFRERRGLTLQEVASRSGLSRSYISEIENGKKQPSLKTLEALAGALNVALEALMPEGDLEVDAEADNPLGDRLRLARERKGMSLAEAAEAAGISVSYLSEIERGQAQPAVETLRLLAQVVGLPLSQVFHCGTIGDRSRMRGAWVIGGTRADGRCDAGLHCPAGKQQDPGFFDHLKADSPVP